MKSMKIFSMNRAGLLFLGMALTITHCQAGEGCMDTNNPVCGQDGKTYTNACYAGRAGVVVKHQGACALHQIICPMVFMPVCGEDNKTYSNACFARAAGVKTAKTGSCQ